MVIGESGVCGDAITACITFAWKVFRQLLPILTDPNICYTNCGNVFNACVRKVLLYISKTWPTTCENTNYIISANNGMI